MTKEWSMKNCISPVCYVHQNSRGVTNDYIRLKNRFREIRKNANDDFDTIVLDYMIFSLLADDEKLKSESIAEDMLLDPSLKDEVTRLENEFCDYKSALDRHGMSNQFIRYIRTLSKRIIDLHNELEYRDSFMRIFQDDFECPSNKTLVKNKVLYDEREWRSIKYVADFDLKSNPDEYEGAIKNCFLPQRFNLKFNDDDLVAVLVESEKVRKKLIEFIKNESTLIPYKNAESKVVEICKFSEQ